MFGGGAEEAIPVPESAREPLPRTGFVSDGQSMSIGFEASARARSGRAACAAHAFIAIIPTFVSFRPINDIDAMRKVRLGTVSFLIEDTPHTFQMNIERACGYIEHAAGLGCDVVCLPEMLRTYNVPGRELEPEPFPGPTSTMLSEAAREGRINVIATWYVEIDGRVYNQATIFDRDGAVAGWYRKVQPTAAEAKVIRSGSAFPVFRLDFGTVAVMICMDIHFPEIARIYAHKGADVIFWPTTMYGPTREGLQAQITARAIDNSVVIVESNMAGHPPAASYAGRHLPATARIVDHNGDILAQTGRRHGIATAEIDLDEVRLTSGCVLIREPDQFREDLASITRLDLFAREYAAIAASQRRHDPYFSNLDDPEPTTEVRP